MRFVRSYFSCSLLERLIPRSLSISHILYHADSPLYNHPQLTVGKRSSVLHILVKENQYIFMTQPLCAQYNTSWCEKWIMGFTIHIIFPCDPGKCYPSHELRRTASEQSWALGQPLLLFREPQQARAGPHIEKQVSKSFTYAPLSTSYHVLSSCFGKTESLQQPYKVGIEIPALPIWTLWHRWFWLLEVK